jgi:signal peptidase I
MYEAKVSQVVIDLTGDMSFSGKGLCFRVASSSMLPLIRPGDEITVKRLAWKEVWFSDIVVYRKYDELYVHRLLWKRKQGNLRYFVVKADCGFTLEKIPGEDDWFGKVIAVNRKGNTIDLGQAKYRIISLAIGVASGYTGLVYEILRRIKRITLKSLERIIRA